MLNNQNSWMSSFLGIAMDQLLDYDVYQFWSFGLLWPTISGPCRHVETTMELL